MAEIEAGKISRREQILDAAFSLIQINDRWSLSEIASIIGVSKTAIYRHFKNREEIEIAMDAVLYEDILGVIKETDFSPASIRLNFITFFRSHPGHLFLLMHNIMAVKDYDEYLYTRMEQESSKIAEFSKYVQKKTPGKQQEILSGVLKNTVSILIASFPIKGIEKVQNELVVMLGRGFPELKIPSEARLDELEKICQIHPDELATCNKLLNAIASTINIYGVTNTTIERIAKEMGSAKSSLYFYFRNKNEMLFQLIKNETNTIINLCASRASKGETLAEQIFILMLVQANYLLFKPEILAVFNWIRYETIRKPKDSAGMNFDLDSFLKPFHIDQIFPAGPDQKMRAIGLLKWASIISTSTVIQAQRHEADKHNASKNIRIMFQSMMNGDREI